MTLTQELCAYRMARCVNFVHKQNQWDRYKPLWTRRVAGLFVASVGGAAPAKDRPPQNYPSRRLVEADALFARPQPDPKPSMGSALPIVPMAFSASNEFWDSTGNPKSRIGLLDWPYEPQAARAGLQEDSSASNAPVPCLSGRLGRHGPRAYRVRCRTLSDPARDRRSLANESIEPARGRRRKAVNLLDIERRDTKRSFFRFARVSFPRGAGYATGGKNPEGHRQCISWGLNFVTIAACYLSPEGVVLGADSASTYIFPSGPHHFNYGQKLYEISREPETGTLGIVTWGLGGLALGSYRTLIAMLSDDFLSSAPATVEEAAIRWVDVLWPAYSTSLDNEIKKCAALGGKLAFDPTQAPDPTRRTIFEEFELTNLKNQLVAGFCIGGYTLPAREPCAFEIVVDPLKGKPVPQRLPPAQSLWGVPAIINRIIKGCGDEVRDAIIATKKWNGTAAELDAVISQYKIAHPQTVPIREAVDFIHVCLLTTVKAMKFSAQPRVCGGPIEVAVITTDRPFRWVQHKSWNAAIRETD
jgi:hypothetical protein